MMKEEKLATHQISSSFLASFNFEMIPELQSLTDEGRTTDRTYVMNTWGGGGQTTRHQHLKASVLSSFGNKQH